MEVLGTIASIVVLISFTQKGEKKIRAINLLGSLLFVIYGISINAFSVWLLNGILFIVHTYNLIIKR